MFISIFPSCASPMFCCRYLHRRKITPTLYQIPLPGPLILIYIIFMRHQHDFGKHGLRWTITCNRKLDGAYQRSLVNPVSCYLIGYLSLGKYSRMIIRAFAVHLDLEIGYGPGVSCSKWKSHPWRCNPLVQPVSIPWGGNHLRLHLVLPRFPVAHLNPEFPVPLNDNFPFQLTFASMFISPITA